MSTTSSTLTISFVFKSQVVPREADTTGHRRLHRTATLVAPDGKELCTWGDVRYLLEVSFGMHKPTTRQGFQCFIVAIPYSVYVLNHYAWSHALRLVAQDQIRAGDRLVLCRKPVPAALSRFVPARFLVTLVSSCDVDRDLAPALAVSDKDTDDHCVKNGAAGTEAKRENNNKDKENNNGDGDGDGESGNITD